MKKTLLVLLAFSMLIVPGCTENDMVCVTMPPSLSFNIVDQTSGADLFFSDQPRYQAADLKVYFKNHRNGLDSVSPKIITYDNWKKSFQIDILHTAGTDTVMLRIKNLPSDRIIYTIDYSRTTECEIPYVSSVKINDAVPVELSINNQLVTIRK